jgi:nicotinamide-nucleotide amidase
LAPGFMVELRGVPVICLPGVPREVWGIYEAHLGAYLAELRAANGAAPAIARGLFRVFGRGEGQISQACRGLIDGVLGASIHYQVKFPETLVKLVVQRATLDEAQGALAVLEQGLRERLGKYLYATGEQALPALVCNKLRERGLLLATAESCTGGLLGEMLTAPPGSSAYFVGAAVCYTNAEKTRALGVPAEVFVSDGAVSEACVQAMARGAIERFGVDLAVAISGIAGPSGGSPEKPVGTVFFACASKRGDEVHVSTKMFSMPFARDMVRLLAAWTGFAMIDTALSELMQREPNAPKAS